MEWDQLTPSGYFDDFSWHTQDDGERQEELTDPFEAVLRRAAPQEASRPVTDAPRPAQDRLHDPGDR